MVRKIKKSKKKEERMKWGEFGNKKFIDENNKKKNL